MIKIKIFTIILFASFSGYSQSNKKRDLYLLFKPDSTCFKWERKQTPSYINNQYFPDRYDVYGVKTINNTRKRETLTLLFSTINKNRYRITDSVEMKKRTIIPYKDVLQVKGIHFDTSDQTHFPYTNVFIVEQLDLNQFKIIQVQSYIGSDVVSSQPMK